MSRRFTLSTPAANDLDEILTHVLETSGEHRAAYVAERFCKTFQELADNPGLGHRRPDLTSTAVLFHAVWSWLVIYKSDEQPLEVVRVIHAARDVETLLEVKPL